MCAEELLIGEKLSTQFEKEKAVLGETVQTLSMKPKTGYGQVETGRVETTVPGRETRGTRVVIIIVKSGTIMSQIENKG